MAGKKYPPLPYDPEIRMDTGETLKVKKRPHGLFIGEVGEDPETYHTIRKVRKHIRQMEDI